MSVLLVPYIRGPHTTIGQQRLAQYSQQKVMESVEFEKRPGWDKNSTEFKETGGLQAVYLPGFVQIFGSKLQDVFQTFSKTIISFFRLQVIKYRKIPKISPGAYIFQRPFLRSLFLEGLIYGGKFAFQNRLG